MKTTGIVRGMDELQRIVIPKSVLLATGVGHWEGQPYEILIDGKDIILRQWAPDYDDPRMEEK